ncbi:MAG: hypothetical protein J6Y64_00555 [Ruminococcus sp.]|nr:hypothetical protein [Ruminococcus sp.]
MTKPKGMEEYDGYPMPEPIIISDEEKQKIMKTVEENRKKIKDLNSK